MAVNEATSRQKAMGRLSIQIAIAAGACIGFGAILLETSDYDNGFWAGLFLVIGSLLVACFVIARIAAVMVSTHSSERVDVAGERPLRSTPWTERETHF